MTLSSIPYWMIKSCSYPYWNMTAPKIASKPMWKLLRNRWRTYIKPPKRDNIEGKNPQKQGQEVPKEGNNKTLQKIKNILKNPTSTESFASNPYLVKATPPFPLFSFRTRNSKYINDEDLKQSGQLSTKETKN